MSSNGLMSIIVFIPLFEGGCLIAMVQIASPLGLMPIISVQKENPLSVAMRKICGTQVSINAIVAMASSEV